MKRRRVFVLGAMVLALLAGGQADANLLLNPGFETDAVMNDPPLTLVTDWTIQGGGIANTVSAPTGPVRSGIGALQLVGNGGYGVPLAQQSFPASPGQVWDLQGYMLAPLPDGLPTGNIFATLKIVFNDGAADLEPASIDIGRADAQPFPGILGLPQVNPDTTPGEWVFSHARGVAPAGTVTATLFALLVDEFAAEVYVDDMRGVLAGDFDLDLDVDATDLGIWEGAVAAGTAVGDADGDGISDGADLLLWQRSMNMPTGGIGAIPEPSTVVLAASGLLLLARRRRATNA